MAYRRRGLSSLSDRQAEQFIESLDEEIDTDEESDPGDDFYSDVEYHSDLEVEELFESPFAPRRGKSTAAEDAKNEGVYDVVAVLLYVIALVQTRSTGGMDYWYNPCHHNNNKVPSFMGYPITKEDMTRMKEQLNTSLGSVQESVKNFTHTIFGATIKDFLNNWYNIGITHVQWLHSDLGVPKKFSNDSFNQILKELSMKNVLTVHQAFFKLMKESFRRYIRIAKAIERMKEDMQDPIYVIRYERDRLELLNLIREEVRQNLKQVLCEIYECVLKIDHNFVQQLIKEDERLDIKYDYNDETSRHLRDGFIYGDLVVTLEHILQFMKAYEKIET
ncbi:uncharacterized protein LOC131675910 [Topomyia yanbarensis]|uniref:uncharacterized protein LOC131675910 n=1 Tax=Topomyia yanbarensis TaxID=2498891 RepID=UPI00273BFA1E|nr:uncharacterized protein LOC131675910 [Topomyia yanbarensis]